MKPCIIYYYFQTTKAWKPESNESHYFWNFTVSKFKSVTIKFLFFSFFISFYIDNSKCATVLNTHEILKH